MITIISLSILATLLFFISVSFLIVGIARKVGSITWIGGLCLLVLAVLAVFYYFELLIPMIIVIGIPAFLFTIIGSSGEESEDSLGFGITYLCIGLFLFWNTFLIWLDSGHYTSMAFMAWFMCFTSVLNALHCHKDYVPILSIISAILFALVAIYLWMMLDLKSMPIFWSGSFAAIFARSFWWLLYERRREAEELWKCILKMDYQFLLVALFLYVYHWV